MTFPAPKGTTGVRNQKRKDVNSLEDAKIIDLFWARKEEAIRQTDKAYGRRLHVLADRILNNREDAQECVNDTYHAAWNHIPPTRPEFLFAFLAKIARHFSFDKLDYQHAKKRDAILVELSEELENCIPAPDDFEKRAESETIGRVISDFLKEQPESMRKVFVRRYWYMDSISDISVSFGISESKAKSILFRMRNKLREYLEKEGVIV